MISPGSGLTPVAFPWRWSAGDSKAAAAHASRGLFLHQVRSAAAFPEARVATMSLCVISDESLASASFEIATAGHTRSLRVLAHQSWRMTQSRCMIFAT